MCRHGRDHHGGSARVRVQLPGGLRARAIQVDLAQRLALRKATALRGSALHQSGRRRRSINRQRWHDRRVRHDAHGTGGQQRDFTRQSKRGVVPQHRGGRRGHHENGCLPGRLSQQCLVTRPRAGERTCKKSQPNSSRHCPRTTVL